MGFSQRTSAVSVYKLEKGKGTILMSSRTNQPLTRPQRISVKQNTHPMPNNQHPEGIIRQSTHRIGNHTNDTTDNGQQNHLRNLWKSPFKRSK